MPRVRIGDERSERESSGHILLRLERSLSIQQNELEAACLQQPDFLYQVAAELALQRSRRDAKKKELEEKEAFLYVDIRHRAAVQDDRVTEAEVKARMTLDREHRRLIEELGQANGLLARWEALKEAFSQRSYMLRELVALYLARYYGDPARSAEHRMRDFAGERVQEARRERRNSREEYD